MEMYILVLYHHSAKGSHLNHALVCLLKNTSNIAPYICSRFQFGHPFEGDELNLSKAPSIKSSEIYVHTFSRIGCGCKSLPRCTFLDMVI